MAVFGVNEADNYGGQGGGGYFSLKDDKDVARVRFLIDKIEDVAGYAVHEVEIDGKKRYVNCLRNYGDPIDVCPCCAAKMPVQVKYFIPLYNIDGNRVQTWERGKKFGAKISSLCSRYPHLVSHIFEIERNGKPGDTGTTYEIYEVDKDETTLEEFTDIPDPFGTIVMDKNADELSCFINAGYFPGDNGNQRGSNAGQPIIHRGADARDVRRTPSNSGGVRREVY